MSDNNTDWAKICSEIVVAAYGTEIVGEQGGWPLCVHPLDECKLGSRGRDPTTLHTYRYAPVPRYHDRADHLDRLMTCLEDEHGWVMGTRTNGKFERRRTVAWVNKPPFAPNRSLVKTSARAFSARWAEAMTLAIHKALMADGAE